MQSNSTPPPCSMYSGEFHPMYAQVCYQSASPTPVKAHIRICTRLSTFATKYNSTQTMQGTILHVFSAYGLCNERNIIG